MTDPLSRDRTERRDRLPADAASAARWRGALGAVVGVGATLPLALWMWGFTVDDALIPVRYARHLASGVGYRFNADGAVTDGVTPLPWAFLLEPLAHADAMTVLLRAKCLGLGAWLGAAAAWGVAVARAPAAAWVKALAVGVLALSVPVAAHAVSGMETALAMALATSAALANSVRAAALVAGLAAALRPEMAAWALVLATMRGLAAEGAAARTPWARAIPIVLALAPFAACATARVLVFGRAAPLSLLAKPSDLEHGFAYAGAALIVCLAPIAAAAPFALRRAPSLATAIALAGLAHVLAVVAVGGDWMPYARLVAPIVPSLLYAFVLASPHARPWSNAARGGIAVALGFLLLARGGTSGRTVGADRGRLVELAKPELAGARRIAVLDIGWVSAASDAPIVDLAGVTDPSIAILPGGHTSKRVDPEMLLDRDPDVLLAYALRGASDALRYTRVVEARLVRSELIADRYEARGWLPLGSAGAGYVVYRRRPSDVP